MTQIVIHIVPQLPPVNSGVGDYATLVGHKSITGLADLTGTVAGAWQFANQRIA